MRVRLSRLNRTMPRNLSRTKITQIATLFGGANKSIALYTLACMLPNFHDGPRWSTRVVWIPNYPPNSIQTLSRVTALFDWAKNTRSHRRIGLGTASWGSRLIRFTGRQLYSSISSYWTFIFGWTAKYTPNRSNRFKWLNLSFWVEFARTL